jgi:hypothetical protein
MRPRLKIIAPKSRGCGSSSRVLETLSSNPSTENQTKPNMTPCIRLECYKEQNSQLTVASADHRSLLSSHAEVVGAARLEF